LTALDAVVAARVAHDDGPAVSVKGLTARLGTLSQAGKMGERLGFLLTERHFPTPSGAHFSIPIYHGATAGEIAIFGVGKPENRMVYWP
jgi:hypothetical protein